MGAVSPLASSLNAPPGNCQVIFIPAGPVNRIDDRWVHAAGFIPGTIPPTIATAPGGPMPGTGSTPALTGAPGPVGPPPNPLACTTPDLFA